MDCGRDVRPRFIVINDAERALSSARNTTGKMQLTCTRGPLGIRYDLNCTDDA